MRLRLLSSTLLIAAVGAPAAAQRSLVLPAAFHRAWGRGSSSALGGDSTRTQLVFASPFPSGTTVFSCGLRATGGTADRAAFTADLELRVSSSPNAPGALSSTFAANVGSDEVVVLPRQMVNIVAMPANRSTGLFTRMPFAAPFVYGTNQNNNLLIELLVYGRSGGASWSTDRCFASANGRAATVGQGCGSATIGSSSTNGTYVAGATVSVTLAGAPPNTAAWLLPSADLDELVPGLPLPFDLSQFGAGAGCDLLVRPLTSLPTLTDGAGAASTTFTGPGRGGTGWQWLYQVAPSATNPLGLEATACRAIFFGPEACVPIAQYVWDLFNVNSLTGTSSTDAVPVTWLEVR